MCELPTTASAKYLKKTIYRDFTSPQAAKRGQGKRLKQSIRTYWVPQPAITILGHGESKYTFENWQEGERTATIACLPLRCFVTMGYESITYANGRERSSSIINHRSSRINQATNHELINQSITRSLNQ